MKGGKLKYAFPACNRYERIIKSTQNYKLAVIFISNHKNREYEKTFL